MVTTSTDGSSVDHELWRTLLDPATRPDPFPVYAQLRDRGPLTLPFGPTTVVTRYADCQAVLRNPHSSNDRRKSNVSVARMRQTGKGATPLLDGPMFVFLDPPEHTRLRGLVSKAFTPRVIARLEPFARKVIDDALDDAAERGRLEVLSDVAAPLSGAIMCALVGVPMEDSPLFADWAAQVSLAAFDPLTTSTPDEASIMRLKASITDYFKALIAQRRAEPGDDLLSALVAAEESGDQLSVDELISTCAALVMAGYETTVNLIANGVLALLRHPDEWAALVRDPRRATGAVEETLRFDPPVHMISRVAANTIEVGGATAEPGSFVLLVVGATGRDPALVDEPDRFDTGRRASRHLAFSLGPHYCLGAAISRLEGRLAFARITQRVQGACLTEEPLRYKENISLRGLRELPVAFDAVTPRTLPWPATA